MGTNAMRSRRAAGPGSAWGRAASVLAALVASLSLLATAQVVWASSGPASDEVRVATQLAFLEESVAGGAGAQMQALFPEGDFFTQVLSGITAARLAGGSRTDIVAGHSDRWIALARRTLSGIDSPGVRAPFAGAMEVPQGVFYRGWRTLLVVEIATATGAAADLQAVAQEAAGLRTAVAATNGAVLQSYPGQAWPCDNVVAMAALARAGDLLGTGDRALAQAWLRRLDGLRDTATGLLPHRVALDGAMLEGPRASSQAIIQTVLPDVDPAAAAADWAAYRKAFVVREVGLIGVREYPVGVSGRGDVDSGPLVLGVSASASAVTLAAARRVGDAELADALDREAELLGLGWSWGGTRRYAGGLLPVGDAFLAWARSTPAPSGGSLAPGAGVTGPWWAVFVALTAWPAVAIGGLAWWARSRRRRAGRLRGH